MHKKKFLAVVIATLALAMVLASTACNPADIQTIIDNNMSKLSTPTNITLDDDDILRWDAVSNAASYTVNIAGVTYSTDVPSFDVKSVLTKNGNYEVYVKAKSNQSTISDSDLSSVYKFQYNGIVVDK